MKGPKLSLVEDELVNARSRLVKTTKITLQVPEELVAEAREFDVLTDETMTTLLREEVDRRVMNMVNEEIQAYRTEKASETTGP